MATNRVKRTENPERFSGLDNPADLARHRAFCNVCRHPERAQIDRQFLDWHSPRKIAAEYKLGSARAIYRHAHACGLFVKRRRNLLAALDRFIEHVGEIKPTPSSVVSAIRLAADLNSLGQWVEPGDRIYLREVFDRMTPEELDAYARDGSMPHWYRAATAPNGLLLRAFDAKEPAAPLPGAALSVKNADKSPDRS